MININELRIGSIIFHDNRNKIVRVLGLSDDDISYKDNGVFKSDKSDNFSPLRISGVLDQLIQNSILIKRPRKKIFISFLPKRKHIF